MGEPPDWYELLYAARYLRVGPWELIDHAEWIEPALAAAAGEARAAEYHAQRASRG